MKLEYDIEGLVHISQISETHVDKVPSVLAVGQEVSARVIEIDSNDRRIGLSIKTADSDETAFTDEMKALDKMQNATELVRENSTTSRRLCLRRVRPFNRTEVAQTNLIWDELKRQSVRATSTKALLESKTSRCFVTAASITSQEVVQLQWKLSDNQRIELW